MLSIRGLVLLSILALGLSACSDASAPDRMPETLADPVEEGTPITFSGQVLLQGAVARRTQGAIVLTVRYVGGESAILQRFYEIGDPWRAGDSLQFGLSAQDKVVDELPTFARRMALVVRFDADGNPETSGRDDLEVETVVRTGAHDIAVGLGHTDTDAPRAASAGTK